MKTNVVKFALSVACLTVLTACSGGGGKGGNSSTATPEPVNPAPVVTTPAPAPAPTPAPAPAPTIADKGDVPSFGHKFVKKTASDFVLDGTGNVSSISQGSQENMDIALHESLDTVVISIPYKKENGVFVPDASKPVGYVEDFDFRKDGTDLATARQNGKTTLHHIYKTADGSTNSTVARTIIEGDAPKTAEEAVKIRNVTEDTKTRSKGQHTGEVLVYQTGRTNYIGTEEAVTSKLRADSNPDFRDRNNTVAEVYGNRTFVVGNAETGEDAAATQQDTGANAPFGKLANGEYAAVKLNHVQYGRVTSKLSGVEADALKSGIVAGSADKPRYTSVVSYADYNTEGSENTYFYRGSGDSAYNTNLTTQLADRYATTVDNVKTPAGKLTYQGHAVSYGLSHIAPNAKEGDGTRLANAVYRGPEPELAALVSGTHVVADIDLANKQVNGSLYDVWKVGNEQTNKDIATFSGTLHNNGQISGSSNRVADGAAGSFEANLYGRYAEELGGGIASHAQAADASWGAVFGAKVQNDVYVAPPVDNGAKHGVRTQEDK